jgi:hypothetical protein
MNFIMNFLHFWYDFIVGDDWMIAAGVVTALVVSVVLARQGLNAWWLMLAAVVAMLVISIWREVRKAH